MADGAGATDFVLALQQPRGEIVWARHADSTPFTFALLTGSSSICHSLRCSIAIARELGHERPNWELAAARLFARDPRRSRRLRPEAPLGDGLVLPRAVRRDDRRGRARASGAPPRRVHARRLGRALRVGPPVGHRGRDVRVRHRAPRGRRGRHRPRPCSRGRNGCAPRATATGPASSSPTRSTSPAASSRRTRAAAVILAADALGGKSADLGPVQRPHLAARRLRALPRRPYALMCSRRPPGGDCGAMPQIDDAARSRRISAGCQARSRQRPSPHPHARRRARLGGRRAGDDVRSGAGTASAAPAGAHAARSAASPATPPRRCPATTATSATASPSPTRAPIRPARAIPAAGCRSRSSTWCSSRSSASSRWSGTARAGPGRAERPLVTTG